MDELYDKNMTFLRIEKYSRMPPQEIDAQLMVRLLSAYEDSISYLKIPEENNFGPTHSGIWEYPGGGVLSDLMLLTHGDMKRMKVLDLACGSAYQYDYHSDIWQPLHAEILTRLGADVLGIDIRPNPKATYKHMILNLSADLNELMARLKGDYDVIFAARLMGGLKCDAYIDLEKRTIDIANALSDKRQMLVTDLDSKIYGFKQVFPVTIKNYNQLLFRSL